MDLQRVKKRKNLTSIFNINKGDIISITGAGGKTSMMFRLASNLKKMGSVLITTSTKIAIPNDGFDFLFTSYDDYKKALMDGKISNLKNKVLCLGEKLEGKEKLASLEYERIKEICKEFDFCLIEADGSRRLPFKFWYDYEPVIYDFSNKVIGILPMHVYGIKPSEEFIYNYSGYIDYVGEIEKNKKIDYKSYAKLIKYNKGLYKGFEGPKYLFLNRVESEIDFERACLIGNAIKLLDRTKDQLSCKEIIRTFGSIKEDIYYEN